MQEQEIRERLKGLKLELSEIQSLNAEYSRAVRTVTAKYAYDRRRERLEQIVQELALLGDRKMQ